MNMHDEINHYRKEFIYENYIRIVEDFKDYEKITRTKMLEAIYKVYDEPNNIIDICTTRELKYLDKVLKGEIPKIKRGTKPWLSRKDYMEEEYEWEKESLRKKFLLNYDFYTSTIPNEIIDKVKEAIKKVNWKRRAKVDELSEFIIGYCKIQGTILLDPLINLVSQMSKIEKDVILNYILNNKLFNYYVALVNADIESENVLPMAIYRDYYDYEEELAEQRKAQGIAGNQEIDIRSYKNIFYNDFDLENPKIKKFLDELVNLPFIWTSALDEIKVFALLNIDRKPLKEAIQNVPSLQDKDLNQFFKDMDQAMDEMPSGALNGFTPNEAKQINTMATKNKIEKEHNYTPQQNACLNAKDARLFYKIYFALLEFTNKEYKINPRLKVYKQHRFNPNELNPIIEKFWDNKEKIVSSFCAANPYKFNNDEIKITNEFKKGIRGTFIIAKYEKDYTAFMSTDRIYMVKGLNDNIDKFLPYTELPCMCTATIIPFKTQLVYDGVISGTDIDFGNEFEEVVKRTYSTLMKYYHI